MSVRRRTKSLIILSIFLIILISILVKFPPALRKFIPLNVRDEYLPSTDVKSVLNFQMLKSLPYICWSGEKVENEISGVLKYDPEKSFSGYNLYTDYDQNAYLMDMDGKIVHKWQFPFQGRWEQVKLLKNGEIVAICVFPCCFIKLNKDSGVVWIYRIPAHHDIAVLPDNTYLIPVIERDAIYNSRRVMFDSILHLSEKGRVIDEWSTFVNFDRLKQLHHPSELDKKKDIKIVGNASLDYYLNGILDVIRNLYILEEKFMRQLNQKQTGYSPFINQLKEYAGKILEIDEMADYYHLNAIEVLPDTPLGGKDRRFQKGNYLVCFRHANLIIILDKDSKEIVWSWGPGILDWPHDPTMLKNGNILIFDNGAHRPYSRVLEINPVNKNIVWEYKADPPSAFYSRIWGSCQRLPNGNTLICESNKGNVFEITGEGKIVWDFLNPEIKRSRRKGIYQMKRIPQEEIKEWL